MARNPASGVAGVSTAERVLIELTHMYDERYAELERVLEARKVLIEGPRDERLFEKRSEQIEYLFGCLDGLRNAIHLIDPTKWFHGWRDFATWEASLVKSDG